MDMYKLITLVILLNYALSMGVHFADPTHTWQTYTLTNNYQRLTFISQESDDVIQDEDQSILPTNENLQQVSSMISDLALTLIAVAVILVKGVLGGLWAGAAIVREYATTENTFLGMIGFACITFMSMLYIWTALKIYTWKVNKHSE